MTEATSRRRYLRRIAGVAAAVSTLPLAGCTGGGSGDDGDDGDGGDGSDGGDSVTVEMTDGLAFDPGEIEISTGTSVVWENVGSVGHSVTAYEDGIPDGADYFASGGFDSESVARDGYPQEGDIPGGERYQHTFETAGDYEYFCIPHESADMVGTVTVT